MPPPIPAKAAHRDSNGVSRGSFRRGRTQRPKAKFSNATFVNVSSFAEGGSMESNHSSTHDTEQVPVYCVVTPKNSNPSTATRRRPTPTEEDDCLFVENDTTVHFITNKVAYRGPQTTPFTFDRVFDNTGVTRKVYDTMCSRYVRELYKGVDLGLFSYGSNDIGRLSALVGAVPSRQRPARSPSLSTASTSTASDSVPLLLQVLQDLLRHRESHHADHKEITVSISAVDFVGQQAFDVLHPDLLKAAADLEHTDSVFTENGIRVSSYRVKRLMSKELQASLSSNSLRSASSDSSSISLGNGAFSSPRVGGGSFRAPQLAQHEFKSKQKRLQNRIDIAEDTDGELYIADATQFQVSTLEEAEAVVEALRISVVHHRDTAMRSFVDLNDMYYTVLGSQRERTAAPGTLVITVALQQRDSASDGAIASRCLLCDLPSAPTPKSSSKSLQSPVMALQRVVTGLTQQALPHIPYRESKFTRLLSFCLGGYGRAVFLFHIAPDGSERDTTKFALTFSQRVKAVRNQIDPGTYDQTSLQLLKRFPAPKTLLAASALLGGSFSKTSLLLSQRLRRSSMEEEKSEPSKPHFQPLAIKQLAVSGVPKAQVLKPGPKKKGKRRKQGPKYNTLPTRRARTNASAPDVLDVDEEFGLLDEVKEGPGAVIGSKSVPQTGSEDNPKKKKVVKRRVVLRRKKSKKPHRRSRTQASLSAAWTVHSAEAEGSVDNTLSRFGEDDDDDDDSIAEPLDVTADTEVSSLFSSPRRVYAPQAQVASLDDIARDDGRRGFDLESPEPSPRSQGSPLWDALTPQRRSDSPAALETPLKPIAAAPPSPADDSRELRARTRGSPATALHDGEAASELVNRRSNVSPHSSVSQYSEASRLSEGDGTASVDTPTAEEETGKAKTLRRRKSRKKVKRVIRYHRRAKSTGTMPSRGSSPELTPTAVDDALPAATAAESAGPANGAAVHLDEEKKTGEAEGSNEEFKSEAQADHTSSEESPSRKPARLSLSPLRIPSSNDLETNRSGTPTVEGPSDEEPEYLDDVDDDDDDDDDDDGRLHATRFQPLDSPNVSGPGQKRTSPPASPSSPGRRMAPLRQNLKGSRQTSTAAVLRAINQALAMKLVLPGEEEASPRKSLPKTSSSSKLKKMMFWKKKEKDDSDPKGKSLQERSKAQAFERTRELRGEGWVTKAPSVSPLSSKDASSEMIKRLNSSRTLRGARSFVGIKLDSIVELLYKTVTITKRPIGIQLMPGLKSHGIAVGAIVDALSPTSEAASQQIFVGDRIVAINGRDVRHAKYQAIVNILRNESLSTKGIKALLAQDKIEREKGILSSRFSFKEKGGPKPLHIVFQRHVLVYSALAAGGVRHFSDFCAKQLRRYSNRDRRHVLLALAKGIPLSCLGLVFDVPGTFYVNQGIAPPPPRGGVPLNTVPEEAEEEEEEEQDEEAKTVEPRGQHSGEEGKGTEHEDQGSSDDSDDSAYPPPYFSRAARAQGRNGSGGGIAAVPVPVVLSPPDWVGTAPPMKQLLALAG